MKRNRIMKVMKAAWCAMVAVLFIGSGSFLPKASLAEGSETEFMKAHPNLSAKFEDNVRHMMEVDGITGMAVALTDEQGILWAEGYGYTDNSLIKRVDTDTVFSIQSISKTVTATAVVNAAREGLLDLDRPIVDYLPDFSVHSVFEENPERKITLRHLLSHTAGFTHEAPIGSNYDADARSFEDHIKSISNTWLRFPVGKAYGYSNLGVDLAGYILQKVSGQPFQSYVDQNLSGSIGMENSTFDMARIKKSSNRAAGLNKGYSYMPMEIPMIPSGGFYSSALDMAKFLRYHMNNSEALNEMYTIPFPIGGQTVGYALGVTRYDKFGTYFLNHNGGGFGFASSMTWYPELKIGVIVLANMSDTPAGYIWPYDLGMALLDEVIRDGTTVYHDRMTRLPAPVMRTVSDSALGARLVYEVKRGLLQVENKPAADTSRYSSIPGIYTVKMAGIPFFCSFITITERNGVLYKDGSALVQTQPGLFFTEDGEALDLRASVKTYRNIRIQKLPFGLMFIQATPIAFAILFILTIVLLAVRRKKCRAVTKGAASAAARAMAGIGAAVCLMFIASYAMMIGFYLQFLNGGAVSLPQLQTEGAVILAMRVLSPLMLLFAVSSLIFSVIAWIKRWWHRFDRISYTCACATVLLFVLFLLRINVLIL